MFSKVLSAVLLGFSLLNAQDLVSSALINFDSTKTGLSNSKNIKIYNLGSAPFSGKISFQDRLVFSAADSIVSIPAGDSISVTFSFAPKSNILYQSYCVLMNPDSSSALAIGLRGAGYFGDSYDATTYNKYDVSLKAALTALVINHTSLGYNTARDRMFETIDDYGGDTIECVYTGKKIYATTRTIAQNLGFNTEHTWPQSAFNSADPMVSDLNHLYPTDATPNSIRSNYPFGWVVSGVTWSVGGSRLGKDANNATVFEPRDIHKGNVARTMLYFILRYTSNYGTFLDAPQEKAYREWNKLDTVESRERRRNNYLQQYQGKRNPLIDHPEFTDRIYSFLTATNRPVITSGSVYPKRVSFDTVNAGETAPVSLYLVNTGSGAIKLDSVSVSGMMIAAYSSLILQPGENERIRISFIPQSAGNYQGIIKVYSGAMSFSVPFTCVALPVTKADERTDSKTEISIVNHPNPFSSSTIINYQLPVTGNTILKVYDILGGEVATLVNEEKTAGKYEIEFSSAGTYRNSIPNGIYICELQSGNKRVFKKILLLR